jgi:hypothetical protein
MRCADPIRSAEQTTEIDMDYFCPGTFDFAYWETFLGLTAALGAIH